MRKVSLDEVRQALLDLGWTAEICLDRMEGECMPEFAAYETLFVFLSDEPAPQSTAQEPSDD